MAIKIISSNYLTSLGEKSEFPADLADEVIFVGRSNSGKSTLLNALCGRKALAKVGATPGKTRTINLFEVLIRENEGADRNVTLIDVPGYGYAKRSQAEITGWDRMLGRYFSDRQPLRFVILVIDCRRDCEEEERWFLKMIPPEKLIIAATKADKLKKNDQRQLPQKLAKQFKIPPARIFAVSLKPKISGIEQLREFLFAA